ncbi:Hypp9108 [Branchiostoma lanceolatum]|uniref:chitin synthase n=1 Tax=Branchiostoma lanceolatum TaxID=7740 RepID=A0A8K0EHY5_BRALA|nr:Hypp9108 [Branchiostoma lanceolatum]
MLLSVLFCMVYSTLFTFALAKDLKNETTINNGDVAVRSKGNADFVALWLILFLPYAFGFTRAVIKEALSSGQPSPTWQSMWLIAAVSLAEVAGLWLFTFHVLTDDHVDVPTAIVLMNVVLIGHFLIPKSINLVSKRWLIPNYVGFVSIGAGVVAQVQWQTISSTSPLLWAIPQSLVFLSIAWSPYAQLFQMEIELKASPNNVASGTNGTENGIQTAHVRATIAKNFFNMVFLAIALFVVPSYFDDRLYGISVPNGFTSLSLRRTEMLLSVLPAFGGYVLGVIACSMCIQLCSFLVPLCLAPMATLVFAVHMDLCPWFGNDLWCRKGDQAVIEDKEYFSVGLVVLGQILCSIYNYKTTAPKIHEKESNTWDEMSKYLESIKKVDASEKLAKEYSWTGKFEAHVYFDNGARGNKLTDFSAQLICRVKDTFDAVDCIVQKTWYGWKLHWTLPGSLQLPLHIHLKDNQKVKSKKRWSQVMYMDYAVNSKESTVEDNAVKYILATDGDVDFDADSIVAMLLQMLSDREEQVGAVCARTHPVGSGPFVWYQMFDYAIGHWLQKVANHVLGSVLCAPGCFSVYRVKAIAKVLEEYRSDAEEASDFLTKDMGEDRWFSTLLVKAGLKINYCAGAVDSTHCPEEFDEFWKQRRRWIPSTLANQFLLLQNWKDVSNNNKYISMVFLLFQVVLLASTIVSPSTCILILTGGLYYGLGVPTWFSIVFFILVTIVFAVICVRYSQETQLKLAKILCFIFLLSMAVAVVGTAVQMVLAMTSHSPSIESVHGDYEGCYRAYVTSDDPLLPHAVTPMTDLTNGKCLDYCYHNHFQYSGTGHPGICYCGSKDDMKNGTKLQEDMCAFPCPGNSGQFCGGSSKPGQISVYYIQESLGIKLPVDVSTLYIAIVAGIHFIAAILHLKEAACIIFGIVYLFTLPCVFILLNVYSLCNLTDRSWGTREARSQQDQDKDKLSYDIMAKLHQFWTFCKRCCQRSGESSNDEAERVTMLDKGNHHGSSNKVGLRSTDGGQQAQAQGLSYPPKGEGTILDAKRDMEKKFKEYQPGVETGINGAPPKKSYLDPNTEQFRLDQSKEEEFKQSLLQLRNSYLLMFLVANSLWLVLMFSLAPHAQLQVLNTNPLGLVFLVTFSLVLGIEFAALVFHRLATFIHSMYGAYPR